jgi:ribosomal protein L11 methyltransferase
LTVREAPIAIAMFELMLHADAERVEMISDALLDELGAQSVSVEDADGAIDVQQSLYGEPGMVQLRAAWPRSTVSALFSDEPSATAAAALLLAQPWAAGITRVQHIRAVPDEDWVRLTQEQFPAVEITPRFWVAPSWHERPAAAMRLIRLDPGMAFGTGTHPTTRMCLRWIARNATLRTTAWTRVLDYGCGSGILAIGAALHGALEVDAVDIDPAALDVTRANAKANQVHINAAAPDLAHGHYELVLANILANPLKLLAPLLTQHVAPSGELVLAGILERQADELAGAYAPWCSLAVDDSDDGWILMTARWSTDIAAHQPHGMIPP